jgi:hypothetical protein
MQLSPINLHAILMGNMVLIITTSAMAATLYPEGYTGSLLQVYIYNISVL